MKLSKLISTLVLSILITACASTADSYHHGDKSTFKTATVQSVRSVDLEGHSSVLGSLTGSILGSIAGASISNSRMSGLNSFIGGVLGSFAGMAAERAVTSEDGIEITVKLDEGDIIAIVQDDETQFSPGDKVKVIDGHDGTRVTH